MALDLQQCQKLWNPIRYQLKKETSRQHKETAAPYAAQSPLPNLVLLSFFGITAIDKFSNPLARYLFEAIFPLVLIPGTTERSHYIGADNPSTNNI